eukprot:3200509-Pyramimonas_sp.AAC.1
MSLARWSSHLSLETPSQLWAPPEMSCARWSIPFRLRHSRNSGLRDAPLEVVQRVLLDIFKSGLWDAAREVVWHVSPETSSQL